MAKKKQAAKPKPKRIATLTHEGETRKNIPSAEMQSVVREEVRDPILVTYSRDGATGLIGEKDQRDPDLDPQLVWRGKDEGPLDVSAPPLYIQEKVHPKALIDDLLRQTETRKGVEDDGYFAPDFFENFNGLPDEAKTTDFYRHDGHWSNRMILGDSLQVMASLSEREGLRGKVQCIYLDPPYGIKFNSNFQCRGRARLQGLLRRALQELGRRAPSRTPTACCDSTCPRAPASCACPRGASRTPARRSHGASESASSGSRPTSCCRRS